MNIVQMSSIKVITGISFLFLLTGGDNGESPPTFDFRQFTKDIFGQELNMQDLSLDSAQASSGRAAAHSDAGSCRDYSNSCRKYARHCYHSTVKRFCKITCKLCSPWPAVIPTPKTTTPPCQDESSFCSLGKQYGYCNGKAGPYITSYMRKKCQKTCGFCGGEVKKPCTDEKKEYHCQRLKTLGYCKRVDYRRWLLKYCEKTCELCYLTSRFSCGIPKARNQVYVSAIVGGTAAEKGHWPWQVAILYNGDEFICGGTLIKPNYVISAAHCFKTRSLDTSKYRVILGEHNRGYKEGTEQYVDVKRIVVHRKYTDNGHDIAIMELKSATALSKFIITACLPYEGDTPAPGTECYISGWGKIHHPGKSVKILQQAKMSVVSTKQCKERNDRRGGRKVDSTMICAHNTQNIFTSGCHGDSGGPLVCKNGTGNWILHGVVSWGSPMCFGLDKYTVFTKVSAFRRWIDRKIG